MIKTIIVVFCLGLCLVSSPDLRTLGSTRATHTQNEKKPSVPNLPDQHGNNTAYLGNLRLVQGADRSGVSKETGLPLDWSATKNIIWKSELPGPGSSSPIVFGDHVYVTSYSGYGLDKTAPGNLADLKRHCERLDLAKVDKLFAKWNRPDTPGCAVGIVQNGKLIYSKGFGSANLEYQVPNTPQTVFEAASFSKSLSCACLALLMDEGKIAPEDELRKFVPGVCR